MKNNAYLISLSGGLDSTYLLYKLLQENKHVFILHTILIKKDHQYFEQELHATKEIIKWCNKNCKGKIVLTKYPVLDFREFPVFYDVDTVLLLGQKFCRMIVNNFPQYDKIYFCLGAVGDDDPDIARRRRIKGGLSKQL
jgi:tRNA(Ile)-lysidine synthase TilS/MesJ